MKAENIGTPNRNGLLRWLALATIVLFGGGGLLLIIWQGRSPFDVIRGSASIGVQLLTGTIAGLAIGGAAWAIIGTRWMDPVRARYSQLIGPLVARWSDRVLVSLCAGVGEELFFRGAMQWWLGIPLTAVVFVAIHGYLDPRDRRILVYGLFMTAAMGLLGWLAEAQGLIAPMGAHAVIDIILLEQLRRSWRDRSKDERTTLAQSVE